MKPSFGYLKRSSKLGNLEPDLKRIKNFFRKGEVDEILRLLKKESRFSEGLPKRNIAGKSVSGDVRA